MKPRHHLYSLLRFCWAPLRACQRDRLSQGFWFHTTEDITYTNMQLQIRGQQTTVIECEDNEKIQHIKEKIVCLQGIEDEFHLHCNGSLLTDEICVNELPSDVLELTVPLKGGKVHGSLARAGKVKAQTPKVEKQEKSKKKTGRAKRRIQYNRRFVNVVQTFGRRRGPNANTNS
ncbi:hypothetical protein P5V15_008804 [Pogonomyrmex californicus]